uniref:death domain-associated protein 6 n=1 Tax=Doryrhamphus excisus TaxID=161450 RepID=UPI0025ADA786|nr:death domain-associated protein 6 [Doryrhamphus excisus]XP_057903367.1 death domain-associated protein 6 [Doryrhamphus excisus]XP_057903368.1 death domain-associated protein 6 [Doryrhamphus excisus]XP_057903369.1 death domain-associated protein 6 [Doryrhamphus excisus]
MAVASAALVDKVIVLDYDEENSPQQSSSASPDKAPPVSRLRVQQPAPTHITQSPFASNKQKHVLQAENEKLFSEFVDHCSAMTEDCPQVLTFLQTKHAKACPVFLSSVEFRNSLGRCLTRVQANRSKTFVYINELCTVLRQHAAKRRQTLSAVDASPAATSASDCLPSTSVGCPSTSRMKAESCEPDAVGEDEKPSTSGLQEDEEKAEKRATRASRKQIAYLERLLKVYNEEICQLQRAELTLDELGTGDSSYIQEHKLKRKMMKIYEKLCELKGCGSQTGRVIEQRIVYRSTRYPEINRRIERYINSPEVRRNPPDYQDILQQVLLASKRHNLCLSRKQLNQFAQEAFRETGSQIQERRHLDLVYNFGSHLTDGYVPARDPALMDPSLLRKLRSNREVALSRLDDVISKYAVQQEDTEDQDRMKRQAKEGPKAEPSKAVNGVAKEDEEEDEDEEDMSSDPDIEEEIQASTQQDGADDDEDIEEDDINEAEQMSQGANMEEQTMPESDSAAAAAATESVKDEAMTSEPSPLSDISKSVNSPLTDVTSAGASPSQSEAPSADGGTNTAAKEASSSPMPPEMVGKGNSPVSNGTRNIKRKRTDVSNHISFNNSDMDVLLDMGVICASPPRADCDPASASDCELVSSSQSPPPKKNKVNVATQCDPQEIIELSDSE